MKITPRVQILQQGKGFCVNYYTCTFAVQKYVHSVTIYAEMFV